MIRLHQSREPKFGTRGGHMAYRFKSGPDSMCEFRTAKPYRFCTDLVQIKICTESVLNGKIFFISYRIRSDFNLDQTNIFTVSLIESGPDIFPYTICPPLLSIELGFSDGF